LGARIVSPEDHDARSGITIFNMFESPQEDLELLEALLARKIFMAQRYTSGIGGLRASTHFYNNEEDVEALLAALKELRR
jgi:selenocysteine lyase/cysteine desulfurase